MDYTKQRINYGCRCPKCDRLKKVKTSIGATVMCTKNEKIRTYCTDYISKI